MCQVNNERERNILGEEEDQIGREPIWWRRRRKKKGNKREKNEKEKKKMKKESGKKNQALGKIKSWGREKKGKGREGEGRFSRCFDGRTLIVRELKLVRATRATHGYRNQNFSSKLQEVGVFSYTASSLFKSCKWPGGSAQTRD